MSGRLLFVESNTTGTGMLALAAARRLGYEPVLLTHDPARYRGLAGTGATVVVCDTNAADSLRAAAAGFDAVAGVTTTSEYYLHAVAGLAAWLRLPGNPPEVLRIARDKGAVRQVMTEIGLPGPRWSLVGDDAAVAGAVAHVGLPCVVKPVDDSGSHNVRVCATVDEALDQVRAIRATTHNARGQRMAGTALIEQFVDGPEFSVEMFSVDGVAHPVGVTRKTVGAPPYCVETGHLYPADVPPAVADALIVAASGLLGAVGVRTGPTHTELRLGPDGPAVIELNCRLAGGMIPELVRLATGVDLIEQQLRCAVGQRPRLGTPGGRRWAGIRFLTAPSAGRLGAVTGLAEAERVPGVVSVAVTAAPGATVAPAREALDRIGHVVATGDSPAAVRRALDAADLIAVATKESAAA